MKRGRWKSMASLARYERHARVEAEIGALPPATVELCRECATQLEAQFLRGTMPAPLASQPTRASTSSSSTA